jgi:hypothetical protein
MEPLDYCNTILHFGEVNFTSNALDILDNNVTVLDAAVSTLFFVDMMIYTN